MKIRHIIIVGLIAFGIYYYYSGKPITHEGMGQVAPDAPVQTVSKTRPFSFGDGYLMTPLADIEMKARVLSRERYWLDSEAELSPVDLALGWGPMSDDAVLSQLDISQRNRWYYWRYEDKIPVSRDQIEHNSANMHMIPGDDNIESTVKSVKTGDIVRLKGHLVKVNRDDGWYWISSITRKDTGGGACEVIFLKEFDIVTPEK